jgi:hypothetical protein
MEEKYLNEIYQLSGWVARHCFCAFQCSKTSKHIRFERVSGFHGCHVLISGSELWDCKNTIKRQQNDIYSISPAVHWKDYVWIESPRD